VKAHRAGCRDELFRAAEVRGQLPWDERRELLAGSGAWDGVRQDATAAVFPEVPKKPDAGAEILAGPEPDGRARDGLRSGVRA